MRVKLIVYGAIDKFYESLSSMKFLVQVIYLRVWYCLCYEEGFMELILTQVSNEDSKRLYMGSVYFVTDPFLW